jgi:hypothetical protein
MDFPQWIAEFLLANNGIESWAPWTWLETWLRHLEVEEKRETGVVRPA